MVTRTATAANGTWSPLAEGTYTGTLVKIEDTTIPASERFNKPERDGLYLSWVVKDDDTDEYRDLRSRVAHSLHEKATFTKVFEALGVPVPPDLTWADDDLIGKQCLVQVDQYEKDGKNYNGVKGYAAMPSALKKLAAMDSNGAFLYFQEREAWRAARDAEKKADDAPTF